MLSIDVVTSTIHMLNKNLQILSPEISTHIYLAIENLMIARNLSEDLTE
jgi:hypothetical protein